MMRSIEVNHEILLKRLRDKNDIALRPPHTHPFFHDEKPSLHDKEASTKTMIPLKEYSNKFLRQSNENIVCKENQKIHQNNRLNSIIKKHKVLQKKYNKLISKKVYICKTEPNETEYQCFMTFTNIHHEPTRVKTENMVHKPQHYQTYFDKGDRRQQANPFACAQEPIARENRTEMESRTLKESKKVNYDSKDVRGKDYPLSCIKEEKISTSRALQMYSKVLCKDKGEIIQKIKICNQKKLIKDRILESTKNLQARQMVLFQKDKKFSIAQRGEKHFSVKTAQKYRKRTISDAHHPFQDDENFQVRGWDISG